MTRWPYFKGGQKAQQQQAKARPRNRTKIEALGHKFDSETEYKYYLYLLTEKAVGNITDIQLQPAVVLQPTFKKNGETIRAVKYTPDFLVTYKDGRQEYIDVKGYGEEDAELKRKIFIFQNDTPLKWVAAAPQYMESDTGWVDYFELKKEKARRKRDLMQ